MSALAKIVLYHWSGICVDQIWHDVGDEFLCHGVRPVVRLDAAVFGALQARDVTRFERNGANLRLVNGLAAI